MLNRLEDIEQLIADGDTDAALRQLNNLRKKIDGCEDGPPADNNDWIVECEAQDEVRALIDTLIANLSS